MWPRLLAYTGLRRGDAVRLGRQHIRRGMASIKTEKSGFTLEVSFPILPILQATLTAGPCGDLTFIVGANGKPLAKESFGNEFKAACKEAGVPGLALGVRKIAATRQPRWCHPGGDDGDIRLDRPEHGRALHAHRQRKRLAAQGMTNLATSIPAPSDQVREPERKAE